MSESIKNIHVLIVEDDDVDRERLRRLLGKLSQPVDVYEAASCERAKVLLRAKKFDCVLLDYMLADAIGFELIQAVREHREEICPIIMISTSGTETQVVEAMREGVFDYISKGCLNQAQLQRSIDSSLVWARLETELGETRKRLQHLSLYDSLTGLPNRSLLFDRLDQLVLMSHRTSEVFSLLMMDLNRFKEVNDSLGHDAGDEVLREVATRLTGLVRKSDTVARLGGDEFVCLLPLVGTVENASLVAEKIVEAMRTPILIEDQVITIGISIGVVQFPLHGADGRTLLKRADQAMYQAKQGAKPIRVFCPNQRLVEGTSWQLANSLEQAIKNGELQVHFQPQIDLESRKIIGKEALVRWLHPERGMIPPNKFIPAAEKSPVIVALTDAVLKLALDEERHWRARGFCVPVSVNLSARVLDDESLPARIIAMLDERNLPPECLILELTETALACSPIQARNTLRMISEAGIGISIDDFGSGYTSLKILRDLNIDEIKIDGIFVADIVAEGRDASIIRSIVELGRGFNVHVIAECVELENSWPLLQSLGCRSAQGYSVGKAMSNTDFDRWMLDWAASSVSLPTCQPAAQLFSRPHSRLTSQLPPLCEARRLQPGAIA